MPNLQRLKTMSMTSLPNGTLVVAIALLVLSISSKLCLTTFVSIDCGSSGTSTDTNNITWMGDDAYVQIGESHQVPYASGIISTLRAFPDGKENCYSIVVQNGEKVLTRATFLYGNYDNKGSPPTFDLHFDGNFWTSVKTSSKLYFEYEAIYITKGNSTNICVTQTMDNQIPFISSLEVRSLKSTMYNQVDTNHALILLGRNALGADQDVRYPADVYDRIWKATSGNGLISDVSEALDIDTSMVLDNPPKAVLQNAVTTPSKDNFIVYNFSIPQKAVPLYINTYFSEVAKDVVVAGGRSIELYVDNKRVFGPIIPPFGGVQEVYIKKSVSSDTSLLFMPTLPNPYPPIVNAIEVYEIQTLNAMKI